MDVISTINSKSLANVLDFSHKLKLLISPISLSVVIGFHQLFGFADDRWDRRRFTANVDFPPLKVQIKYRPEVPRDQTIQPGHDCPNRFAGAAFSDQQIRNPGVKSQRSF